MSRGSKPPAGGDIKKLLRSQNGGDKDGGANATSSSHVSQDISQDISNINAILTKISTEIEGLAEIRRTTASTEAKVSTLISRIDEMERRIEYLESVDKDLQANPLANKKDVEAIWEKLEDMENRSRRNNVRFIGFPEGAEGTEVAKFVEDLIPELLSIEETVEIERAHRVPSQRPPIGEKPRPILAKFLRSSDRDLVLRAARNKGKLTWDNSNIMLFPDFSRSTMLKRDKFKDCKKKLHDRGVSFRLVYPATLKVRCEDGEKSFSCPKKAMTFIDSM